ncbi:MAG: exosortase/archaeosortase family protein [Planctomycetaceae bacterium]
MKSPASILPTRQPGPIRPAAPPPEPTHPDETLVEGLQRRFAELRSDLRRPEEATSWAVIVVLTVGLVYSYWPGLMNARASWDNPQYSHGWLVPLCSLVLLFWWRRPFAAVEDSARLAGLGIIAATFVFRLLCAKYRIITLDMYSFVPALAGVFLMVGGWRTFRWAWAPIAALIFMYPLPDEATRYLLGPLQTLATMVSTFAIQTLGIDAFREGNRIVLGESRVLGVVDACSGLRMLTIFVWLALMIVLVGGGEWWENALIMASAIPIALAVNAIRITATGVMYTFSPEMAEKLFHDWAGYFMMPLALLFLFGLQQMLSWLVVGEEVAPAAVLPRTPAGRGPAVVSVPGARPKTRENPAGPQGSPPAAPAGGN